MTDVHIVHIYISFMNQLGKFVWRSKRFLWSDYFIYSHNIFSWLCIDIVRRKLIFVTLGTLSVKEITSRKKKISTYGPDHVVVSTRRSCSCSSYDPYAFISIGCSSEKVVLLRKTTGISAALRSRTPISVKTESTLWLFRCELKKRHRFASFRDVLSIWDWNGLSTDIWHRALFNWVSKTKTKVITTANQSKGNYQREPMATRSKRV